MRLYGAGGKGGGGSVRTPYEAEDTLQSRSWVRFIDLIGEGPLDGFADNDGRPVVDCELLTGAEPTIVDGAITYDETDFPRTLGLITTATTANNRGYILRTASNNPAYPQDIPCIVQGDGKDAQITAVTYSLNERPEGVIRGLRIDNPGTGYSRVRLLIPPATGTAIFFDDVPLVDPNTFVYNMAGAKLAYRLGYPDQTVMPGGFDSVQETLAVSMQEIRHDVPFTFEFSGDYDYLSLDIALRQGFYKQNTGNGDILPMDNLFLQIEQQYRGTGMSSYAAPIPLGEGLFRISGKTLSEYIRTYVARLYRLPNSTDHSWLIKITRVTVDDKELGEESNGGYRFFTRFGLSGVTLSRAVRLSYPHSAIVGLELNAQQFSRIPVRTYQMRLLRVQVPSNYFAPGSTRADGTVRDFAEYNRRADGSEYWVSTGIVGSVPWDGTFYESWTDNPAWVFYAVCTHWRYGLGDVLPSADKWFLYRIGRYCDEPVSSGWANGAYRAKEARFRCNLYIQSREEAWQVLTDIAAIFRGMVYWSLGSVIAIQEAPKPIRGIFGPANVIDGLFTYSSTELRHRYTVAVVSFNDPLNGFKQTPIVVENPRGIVRYGWQQLELSMMGCTSRGQARRQGQYVLAAANLTDVVTYGVGAEGALYRPGDRVGVQDPNRAQAVLSGRVSDVASDDADKHGIIILDFKLPDNLLSLTVLNNYRLMMSRPAAPLNTAAITSETDVYDWASTQVTPDSEGLIRSFGLDSKQRTVVHLVGALPARVAPGAVWVLKALTAVVPATFTVTSVVEKTPTTYTMTGVEYNPNIFDITDEPSDVQAEPINPYPDSWTRPDAPRNFNAQVIAKDDGGNRSWTIAVSWSPPLRGLVREYRVSYSRAGSNYQLLTLTGQTFVEHLVNAPDVYSYRIQAIGITGLLSDALTGTTIAGELDGTNAEVISGLELRGLGNATVFTAAEPVFDWRLNWSDAGSEAQFGGEYSQLPPGVASYRVRIRTVNQIESYDVGAVLQEFSVTEPSFTLTKEMNGALFGGPHREFIFDVAVVTTNGAVSAARRLRVRNEKPVALANIVVSEERTGLVRFSLLDFAPTSDFRHIVLFRSEVEDFIATLDDAIGYFTESQLSVGGTLGTTYYYRIGVIDWLAKDSLDCNLSLQLTATPTRVNGTTVFDFMR